MAVKGKRLSKDKKKACTTKRIVWLCLINGLLWVWCSYALAFYGALSGTGAMVQIAESLSQVAITEVIGVTLVYCLKSLFEKRKDFGSVGCDGFGTNENMMGEEKHD